MTLLGRTAVGAGLSAALALAFLWSAPATGHLDGTVIFGGCPGTEPANPGLGYACTYRPVGGAVVYVLPIHGAAVSVVTDRSGRFQLDLTPGFYKVEVQVDVFEVLQPNGPPHHPSWAGTAKGVWIVSHKNAHVDLGIMTMMM